MGERGGRGDNDNDCRRGGCIYLIIIERRKQRLGGKGGRGTTSTMMAGGEIVSSLSPLSLSLLLTSGAQYPRGNRAGELWQACCGALHC